MARKQKPLSVFNGKIESTLPLSAESDTGSTKKGARSKRSPRRGNTPKTTASTKVTSKNTSQKKENLDIALHAEFLRTAVLLLEEQGYCRRATIKGNDEYVFVAFPVSLWDSDINLKK